MIIDSCYLKENGFVPIIHHERFYFINIKGEIVALPFKNSGFKIVKQWIDNNGYKKVTLIRPKKKGWFVHRLIAIHFIDKVDGKDFIDHIDGDKCNNDVSNLRWCTHKENINNPIRIQKCSKTQKEISRCPWHKPVESFSLDGVFLNKYKSIIEAAEATNSDRGHISSVANGKRKTHNGLIWNFCK